MCTVTYRQVNTGSEQVVSKKTHTVCWILENVKWTKNINHASGVSLLRRISVLFFFFFCAIIVYRGRCKSVIVYSVILKTAPDTKNWFYSLLRVISFFLFFISPYTSLAEQVIVIAVHHNWKVRTPRGRRRNTTNPWLWLKKLTRFRILLALATLYRVLYEPRYPETSLAPY